MHWPTPDPNIEIYPMPAFPTLRVSDLVASSQWYQEALGFQHVATLPGPDGQPSLIHLRWAKYADVLLVPEGQPPAGPRGLGITLSYTLTDGTVDALADRARQAGATILHGPVDQPWNVREVGIADPDGFQLIFTRVINPNLGWENLGKRLMQSE